MYLHGQDVMYLLLYVDDMLLTGSNDKLIQRLLEGLNREFRMNDMGGLQYFLGIQAHFHQQGIFLCQEKYAMELLVTAGMQDCSPIATTLPLHPATVLGQDQPFSDASYFRCLAGKLQYITLTRPDLQFAVNFVCQKMHSPSVADFSNLKRILRYVKGTLQYGINLTGDTDFTIRAYSDSDWSRCKDTSRSTGGFCTFLGKNIISWSAKKHPTVSRSSTEAEYRTMSYAAEELKWLSCLLGEMGLSQTVPPELYCDNMSACYLTANPTQHNRTKHFDNDFHYVRERVALGALVVKKIPAADQIADIFTKSLAHKPYSDLRFKLGVELPPASSLRGCISDTKPKLEHKALVSQAHSPVSQAQASTLLKPKPSSSSSVLSPSSNGNRMTLTAGGQGTEKRSHQIQLRNSFGVLGSRAVTCH